MCTVTFLPIGQNDFILTSNRDVPYSRKKALAPQEYVEDGIVLRYPKDGEAGGTWIGTSDKNRLICLMNGGFKNHKPRASYRRSRGLVVKDLLKAEHTTEILQNIDLTDIEPFTIVIVDWKEETTLFEFIWTGEKKHLFDIPPIPYIWSSSTLYSEATKKQRELWFEEWKTRQDSFRQEQIIQFHKTAGDGNPETDVFMRRDGGGTVSITCVKKIGEQIDFSYEDVKLRASTY